MKLRKKISAILFLFASLFAFNAAQAQVSVNINIGSQALWGPVGYNYVEYYYIPEADVFYYVPTRQFIYWSGNRHIFVSTLPSSFHVNLFSTYKVVVNKPKPYLNHGYYVSNYAKYKHGGPKQMIIRDSDDSKYYVVKGHLKYKGGQMKNKKGKHRTYKGKGH